jgi:hypothetical protein
MKGAAPPPNMGLVACTVHHGICQFITVLNALSNAYGGAGNGGVHWLSMVASVAQEDRTNLGHTTEPAGAIVASVACVCTCGSRGSACALGPVSQGWSNMYVFV